MVKIDGEQYKVYADNFEPVKDLDGIFGWKPETKSGQIINATNTYNDYLDNLNILAPFGGDLVSSGKNLFDVNKFVTLIETYDTSATIITVDGRRCIKFTNSRMYHKNFIGMGINFITNTQYTFTFSAKSFVTKMVDNQLFSGFIYSDENYLIKNVANTGEIYNATSAVFVQKTMVTLINKTVSQIAFSYGNSEIWLIDLNSIQLELGTVATAYEPFRGIQTIPIGMGNFIGAIADRIYWESGTAKKEQNIYKWTIGVELGDLYAIWNPNVSNADYMQFYVVASALPKPPKLGLLDTDINVISSGIFLATPRSPIWALDKNVMIFVNSGNLGLTIQKSLIQPYYTNNWVVALKDYFKAYPVDVWYPIATPVTTDLGRVKTFYPQTNLSLTSGSVAATYKIND